MATKTANYNFVKPELSDVADITAQNPNWDTLDANLKEMSELQNSTSTMATNTKSTVDGLVGSLPQNYQKKLKYGTAAPSGGASGDIYIQIIE